MLLIQSRGRMKCSELASELEVTERQIQKYKADLEQAGIFITSKSGAYGGYEVDKENSITSINLCLEDISVLDMVNEQLKHNNDIYKIIYYIRIYNKKKQIYAINIRSRTCQKCGKPTKTYRTGKSVHAL